MGIQYLQEYIEAECPDACKVVDLLKIGRGVLTKRHPAHRGMFPCDCHLRLVLDAESCLDRLYGGYYSDWSCGGQWNRMLDLLTAVVRACSSVNIELIVFFNGALEISRVGEWSLQQLEIKKRTASVLKHINNKATPPPKVWWIPPVCLRTALRLALRQLGVPLACSVDDHHQEVMAFCRDQGYHGLLADESDYAIFDPPRYFSAKSMKLTMKGPLTTVEFLTDEVAQKLDLNPKRFPVLAALLGNHILPEKDLKDFYKVHCPKATAQSPTRNMDLIAGVVAFVRELESVDDLDEIGKTVFKNNSGKDLKERMGLFKQSVQYYMNGTAEGFLRFRSKHRMGNQRPRQPGSYPGKKKEKQANKQKAKKAAAPADATNDTASKDATKEDDIALPADSVYTTGPSGYADSQQEAEDSVTEDEAPAPPPMTEKEALISEITQSLRCVQMNGKKPEPEEKQPAKKTKETTATASPTDTAPATATDADTATATATAAAKPAEKPKASTEAKNGTTNEDKTAAKPRNAKKAPTKKAEKEGVDMKDRRVTMVSPEIMRIARERHLQGLMIPSIYQILSQGEMKLEAGLEEENDCTLPTSIDLYRQSRSHIYSVLFDLNKKRLIAESNPNQLPKGALDIVIKEWSVRCGSGISAQAETVRAEPLDWKVPSLHQLWLGQNLEDKNRRLRALLSCMRSDTPSMLDTTLVPQHLLVLCLVLRYMLCNWNYRILRRGEIDAFLATAVADVLPDVDAVHADLQLPMLTPRGVQLGTLFMRGVETCIMANDACGAPIPWEMCSPWLFFDGKLFHYKLLKVNNNHSLLEICDGQMESVIRVERMRQAIFENVSPDMALAKPSLGLLQSPYGGPGYYGGGPPGMANPHINFRPAGTGPMGPMMHPGMGGRGGGPPGMGGPMRERGRGILGEHPMGPNSVDGRGGQLQIAGVVVGSWGANTHSRGGRGRGLHIPPHITSVGPSRRGGMGGGPPGHFGPSRPVVGSIASRGRGHVRPYSAGGRGGSQMCYNQRPTSADAYSVREANRSKGRSVARARPQGVNEVTLEDFTKAGGAGRGRGCTIESPTESGIVSVSQLINNNSSVPELMSNNGGIPEQAMIYQDQPPVFQNQQMAYHEQPAYQGQFDDAYLNGGMIENFN